MSKIEQALRRARDDKSALDGDYAADGEPFGSESSSRKRFRRERSNLPAIVRIEPYTRYDIDQQALAANRILSDDYPDSALTSYKMLRTRVLQKMNANKWRTLAVTSPRDGAGKSVTAINLAIAMASQGARDVYLLDLDLRNPEIGNKLGIPGFELDLGEYLAGRNPLSRVCCEVGIEHLFVLPSCQRQPNSSELITSQPMQSLMWSIKGMAREPVVIIDLPAILSADDALAISPLVDGFLLVAAESDTHREDVTRSLEILSDSNVIGVVLNKSSES